VNFLKRIATIINSLRISNAITRNKKPLARLADKIKEGEQRLKALKTPEPVRHGIKVMSKEQLEKFRQIANTLVLQKAEMLEQYKVVYLPDVIDLLKNGEIVEKLMHDPIKGAHPLGVKNAFYYWNVIDYLVEAIILESSAKQMEREIAASKRKLEGFGGFEVHAFKMPEVVRKRIAENLGQSNES
jgi:hypothetical protein